MKIQLELDRLNKIVLQYFIDRYGATHVNDPAGKECHKLYAYMGMMFHDIKIADIGTRTGNSALSLSYNEVNHVDSYDIKQHCGIKRKNISFFEEDILTDSKILQYDLISLDVDPHCGSQETKCFEYLIENNWKGVILLDDIGPRWAAMNAWWNSITLPKWDVTKYGHESGTGIVDFSGKLEVELL